MFRRGLDHDYRSFADRRILDWGNRSVGHWKTSISGRLADDDDLRLGDDDNLRLGDGRGVGYGLRHRRGSELFAGIPGLEARSGILDEGTRGGALDGLVLGDGHNLERRVQGWSLLGSGALARTGFLARRSDLLARRGFRLRVGGRRRRALDGGRGVWRWLRLDGVGGSRKHKGG